eukprot:TRINITY_DN3469_c0_g1_i1.p1 TRINITY_DN3469_c0_g1~~TRINITY_DN3469_c0_g1_i1.p1  ORF type:complete len:622 (-),score=123.11 TRINITY_DN3469_c0_g1_i1:2-1867(-)
MLRTLFEIKGFRCSHPRNALLKGKGGWIHKAYFHKHTQLLDKKRKLKIVPIQAPRLDIDMSTYHPELIRNFSIVSHIDHGKTTLSTKLLEETGSLHSDNLNPTYLDKLAVEQERGITVKAQTASMFYQYKDKTYLLNLIDTPGHVDFSYEVSRSLKACEGAVLLVDASRGIQAQTMANFWLAFEADLQIVPCVNKIDMKNAQTTLVMKQMVDVFGVDKDAILQISAKNGIGIHTLLNSIIEQIRPPSNSNPDGLFKGLLFDSWYGNEWSGVICLVKVVEGSIKIGDEIRSAYSKKFYAVSDVGIMYPEMKSSGALYPGQVGYICCGMKSTQEALVGDTLCASKYQDLVPFPGFKIPKAMVFGGIYPANESDFTALDEAIHKLKLTDPSVVIQKDSNDVLGLGFRCGFLGLLHMDVFSQRLRQEYGTSVITTAPTVTFRVKVSGDDFVDVSSPSEWPEAGNIVATEEPVLNATIVTPKQYMGDIVKLVQDKRGSGQDVTFLDEERVVIKFVIPLAEVITEFYDKLKTVSSGYATFDYEIGGFQAAPMVKITILLNGDPVGPLSLITHRDKAYEQGRDLVARLKQVLKKQQFELAIQAAIGKKVIARETCVATSTSSPLTLSA